ncbi:MAG: redoxin domain-containing protein [Chloroflexi bacterium]|nr:redoxin domain-containing protein [Chloroflexota bacterium]
MKSLQEALPRFEERNAQVLSVSMDSVFCHQAWAAHNIGGVSFPMLSDFHPKGKVADLYGVYNPDRGLARRSTFIIDKQGLVQVAEVYERGLPDVEKLLADLDRIEGRAGE